MNKKYGLVLILVACITCIGLTFYPWEQIQQWANSIVLTLQDKSNTIVLHPATVLISKIFLLIGLVGVALAGSHGVVQT